MVRALGMPCSQFPSCFTSTLPKPRLFTVSCRSAENGLAERPWKVADARLVLEDGSWLRLAG